ncbi:MAG: polysaccharide biosynthesis protein [Oscillibacter sp.]|nr:polysaccharide biosynthesis protein [Oscillibacter sp.]
MSEQAKKQSFLGGAAILASAVAVVKLIGAFYKLPLNNILGDVGKTYFNTAYEIYSVLLTLSTAGLPLAISKLTSQAQAQGRENEKRKILRVALVLFFVIGAVGSLFMFTCAQDLAHFQNNASAFLSIRALSPAVFCVCLLACIRGYTQGQGNMTPTATSQVLEALCKLGLGLPLAWYLLRMGAGLEAGAAGAIFGVTVGTVVSLLFLAVYLLRHRTAAPALDVTSRSSDLVKAILAIGIPITISDSAMSIITVVDTKIILGQLQPGLGLTEEAAAALKGQYSWAMDMVNMVASFVYPVTTSLIPAAAALFTKKDYAGADRTISTGFRLLALLALPAGVGLSVLSTPIMRLVLPAQREAAWYSGPHLQVLGIACIFICIMILTNAVLQTYGKEKLPIFTVIVGGVVKVVMNYFLVGDPTINIHGAKYSTLACYVVIAGLNLFFVWKYSPRKPKYLSIFAKPVLASALMGLSAKAVYSVAGGVLRASTSYGGNAIATLVAIVAAVGVYAVLVIALRILRAEDVQNIPHGKKIAKLLHLK